MGHETEVDEWIISENAFSPDRAKYFETIMTLANGYLGVRGSSEEGSQNEHPGSYLSGVFNRPDDDPTELPNIPRWLGIRAALDGWQVTPSSGRLLEYRRYLDMKRGTLVRQYRIKRRGRITRVRIERFVSRADVHTAAIRFSITPENYSATVAISADLDSQVSNSGRVHLNATRIEAFELVPESNQVIHGPLHGMLLESRTKESGITISQAATTSLSSGNGPLPVTEKVTVGPGSITQTLSFHAESGVEYVFDKIVTIFSSRDGFADPGEVAVHCNRRALERGYEALLESHERSWLKAWQGSDISIEGDVEAQRAVRFSIFHSLGCAPISSDKVSLAAKGLHGEGYRGHVFWDCEIFNLPFFIHTQPEIARNLLMYRYHTLPGARRKAQAAGYRGAMYAWESADTGDETTPTWAQHLGQEIRIWCGDLEQHISADVAYAAWQYYQATRDRDFLVNYGAEIIFETARFWVSRFEYNSEADRYEIRRVIGPDEYHEHIDNSVFTNAMARWNIQLALELADDFKQNHQDQWTGLKQRLRLSDKRLRIWKRVAEKACIPYSGEMGIHEQFEGFLRLERVDLAALLLSGRPADAVLGRDGVQKSQIIKQADVVMLMYLLGDQFDSRQVESNFEYYAPLCGHGSSLSPSIHSIVSSRLGRAEDALRYFRQSAAIDLDDGMGNGAAGIHMAALGGNWQAIVRGFCGVNASEYALGFSPALPPGWENVNFSLFYQGSPVRVSVTPQEVTLDLTEAQQGRNLPIVVSGARRLVECGRVHSFPIAEPAPGRVEEPAAAPGLEPVPAY
jgi:trehalose/maltose hydrolase-like predicted phosphorylase